MEKVQWNSINKKQKDLHIRKMINHPPYPGMYIYKINVYHENENWFFFISIDRIIINTWGYK